MTHEDVRLLLGPFALDAVDPEERTAIEEHLASCHACREEAARMRRTAAALAASVEEPAPRLWDAIAAELGSGPTPHLRPEPPSQHTPLPTRRAPRRQLGGLLVAAALAVVGPGGAEIVALRHDVGALSRQLVTAQRGTLTSSVLSQPGTRIVELTCSQGARVAVAHAPTGTAVLTAISLPSLPRSQTHQLWGITERGAVSLGLLGTRPTVSIVQTPRTGLMALAITREPATGVVAPTAAPLVEAHLA